MSGCVISPGFVLAYEPFVPVSLPLLSQAGELLTQQVDILLASFYDYEDMSMKLSDDRHLSAAQIEEVSNACVRVSRSMVLIDMLRQITATELPIDAPSLSPGARRTIAQAVIKRMREEAKLDLVDALSEACRS